MTDDSLNISIPIKFEIKTPPRGMTDYDPKALSPRQQNELNQYKLTIRKENLYYLKDHPEIGAIVTMVIRLTFIQRPRNIVEFIAKIFNRPEEQIRKDIKEIMNETQIEYEPIPFTEWEVWDY